MLTLNQATIITKNFGKWIAALLGLLLLIFLIFKVGGAIKNIISPTPPPPPTVSFGLLNETEFPQNPIQKEYQFTLDTVSGDYPAFPDRAKVFKIEQPPTDILALQKAGNNAENAGFTSGPTRVKGDFYLWADPLSPLSRKLTRDIFSSQFSVDSSFLTDQTIISETNPPNPDQAKNNALDFLSKISLLPKDLDMDKSSVQFFAIQNSQLIPQTSLSKSQILKVNLFQKEKDKLPIYYPDPQNSTMIIYIGGRQEQPQVLKADFYHQDISNESATYPIIDAKTAFSKLEEGKAFVASQGNSQNVSIQKITLGYFMSDKKQDYLIPIVVFEGNNGFIAYLSAVKDEWINK